MANYIRDDLAARLCSGTEDFASQLTLDSLAEYYNVSFTPVRAAVSELIEDGLLKKGANRRLTVCTSALQQPLTERTASPPQPPDDPFEKISRDLVELSLQGDPVYLREEATAEKYDISRSAIRNILHRLAGEGMLDHIPRRGWRLRPFRHDDLTAFIEVREVLERKALDLSFGRLRADRLHEMLEANAIPESADTAPAIDESLHEYIIATADNVYIQDFFERQGRYYRLLFDWEDHDYQTAVETVRQHREILLALLNNDLSTAQDKLSHHILHNHPLLDRLADHS